MPISQDILGDYSLVAKEFYQIRYAMVRKLEADEFVEERKTADFNYGAWDSCDRPIALFLSYADAVTKLLEAGYYLAAD